MGGNTNYTIMDPRPIAAEAPYSFFLPHEVELAALRVGDLVKKTETTPRRGMEIAFARLKEVRE